MTQTTQTGRGGESALTGSETTREAILKLWAGGLYDTLDLARRFRLSEAEVYRFVSRRKNDGARAVQPKAHKQRLAKRAVKSVTAPASKPLAKRQYRLRDGIYYLHQSGEGKTPDPRHAWKGSAEQAVACCAKFPDAKSMSMEVVP